MCLFFTAVRAAVKSSATCGKCQFMSGCITYDTSVPVGSIGAVKETQIARLNHIHD